MRSFGFVLAVVLAIPATIAPNTAHGEQSEPSTGRPAWTVQVDYLTTALGFVHVLLERRVARSLSVYGGPHARLFRGILLEDDQFNRGVGIEAGARWFPLRRHVAPEGLWIQGRVVAARVTHEDSAGLGGYLSVIGGYSLIVGGRLVLAGGLGVQYMHYAVAGVGPEGVIPAAHTAVGLAF